MWVYMAINEERNCVRCMCMYVVIIDKERGGDMY